MSSEDNDRLVGQMTVVEQAAPVVGRTVGRVALFNEDGTPFTGGGGGEGTVQTVNGVEPDEDGDVPLTYADIGPIALGDLGFDPETEEEMDAELATINTALGLKADKDTTYTKTQVDAIAAALKVKPFSTDVTYGADDLAVSPSGDLIRANGPISPAANPTYVGRTYAGELSTLVALPAGAQAGDLAVLASTQGLATAVPTPAGWMIVPGFPKNPGSARLHLFYRGLTSADITAGSVSGTNVAGTGNELRVYRNAGLPSVVSTVSGTVNAGATVTVPGYIPPSNSIVTRMYATVYATGVGFTTDPTLTGGVTGTGSWRSSPSYVGGAFANLTSRPLTTADGVATSPLLGGAYQSHYLIVDLAFSPSVGFNPAQWTVLTASGKVRAYNPLKAWSSGEVAASGGDLYSAKTDVPAGGSGPSLVGKTVLSMGSSATTIALPPGCIAGDVALQVRMGDGNWSSPVIPSGFTQIDATWLDSAGIGRINTVFKVLTSTDISTGTVPRDNSASTYHGDSLFIFRSAGTPSLAHAIQRTDAPISGATLTTPAFTTSPAAKVLRLGVAFSTAGNFSANTMAYGGTFDSGTSFRDGSIGGSYNQIVAAVLSGPEITTAYGTLITPPSSNPATTRILQADIEIPAGGTPPAGQWTKILDGSLLTTPLAVRVTSLEGADKAAGTASLRTLGTGAQQAAAGNDSRLSDSRTPLGQSVSTAKLADDLIPAGLSTGNAATNAIAARRIGTQAYDAAPGTLVATVDARLSAAQRTAINALDAGTATVADIVNALKT